MTHLAGNIPTENRGFSMSGTYSTSKFTNLLVQNRLASMRLQCVSMLTCVAGAFSRPRWLDENVTWVCIL